MSPLVSILLPNYNHAQFLPQRLKSIYNQTYPNTEIIILDDVSQDNSTSLIKEYAQHPKTKYLIINKINSGSTFLQWQKGINLAKGKYIWIAESDDWASLDFLEKLVPILEKDEDTALVYCQSKKVNQEGEMVDDMVHYTDIFSPNKWEAAYINSGDEEIQNYLVHKNTIPNASAVVFRNRKNISELIRTDMTMAGDWWFWIQILKGKKIAFIPERLNFHRSHANTTRNNLNLARKKENILEQLAILNHILGTYPNIQPKIKFQKEQLLLQFINWVSPFHFPSIQPFIQEHFPNSNTFPLLVAKAYANFIKNKLKGAKRMLRLSY